MNKYLEEQAGKGPFSIPRYNLSLSPCMPNMKFLTGYGCLRNLLRKITVLNAWRGRKVNKYRKEQRGEGWFSIPQYNLLLLTCIPNINFLSYTVAEISLTKINGEKEKWTNTGKNKQERTQFSIPQYNLSVVTLYTTGEGQFSIPQYNLLLSPCIPNMKFLSYLVLEISLTKKCYGITEGRKDGRNYGQM